MASFFTKFARGAATAGATLFRDQAMNQMKMDLAMKRDMMLEKNRATAVTKAQEFKSGEAEVERTFQSEQQTARLDAQKATPQAKLAELRLGEAKSLATLKKAHAEATDDPGRFEAAKAIMAAQGKPIEANASKLRPMEADVQNMIKAGIIKTAKEGYEKLLNPNDSFGLLLWTLKALQVDQENVLMQEDRKSPQEILTEGQRLVDEHLNKGGDVATGAGTVSAADVPQGARRATGPNGARMALVNNKWLKVI